MVGTAIVAVATPIMTAGVDGICVTVLVALAIWELWSPTKAIADQALDCLMLTGRRARAPH